MKKLHAKYWSYDGNHSGGRDCERKDPHGFGVDLISYLAYVADHKQGIFSPLTIKDLSEVKVVHSKGNDFGHEVKVAAPNEVWEKAKVSQQKMLLEYA